MVVTVGAHVKLFVNGTLTAVSGSVVTHEPLSSNVFYVGGSVQSTNKSGETDDNRGRGYNRTTAVTRNGFVGSVDELRVWNEALSEATIALHLSQGPG